MELPAAALNRGNHPWCPPIIWVTMWGQSWPLDMLRRGQIWRQPERWRREHRQSICDVHRFLMRPRARLAIQGSIRSRCLEKLSTAHCSKTLHYLITTAPSLGGRMSPAASVPPSMCHPPQGWTWGGKCQCPGRTQRLSPWVPGPPASLLPGCKCGCRKRYLTAPTQQLQKKGEKGQFWERGDSSEPQTSQAGASRRQGWPSPSESPAVPHNGFGS